MHDEPTIGRRKKFLQTGLKLEFYSKNDYCALAVILVKSWNNLY